VRENEALVTHTKEAAVSTGLVRNESKTKYMKRYRTVTNLEQDLITNGHVFEGVHNLRYLVALIDSKHLISEAIKSKIAASNRCFYGPRQIFRSRAMNKAVKIKINKTMVQPVVLCGSATWGMTEMDMKRMDTWRGKC